MEKVEFLCWWVGIVPTFGLCVSMVKLRIGVCPTAE